MCFGVELGIICYSLISAEVKITTSIKEPAAFSPVDVVVPRNIIISGKTKLERKTHTSSRAGKDESVQLCYEIVCTL